jgi:hypothetical protein
MEKLAGDRARSLALAWSLAPGSALAWAGGQSSAADAPKPAPDVLVFTNGDQLSGKLLREDKNQVTFHSDIAGDVTVGWDKVKSIQSAQQFAVVKNGQRVKKKMPQKEVAQGALSIENGTISVSNPSAGVNQQIPIADTQYIIDEKTFQTEILREPSFLFGWDGSLTIGATEVNSTQTSQTFTGAATLVRTIPAVDWLDPRNKTTFDASATYGLIRQPLIQSGTTVIQPASSTKTNILHGDAERDEYIGTRAYLLAEASADHNLGSGLQLQQQYGGGGGATILKQPKQTFDVKGDLHYEQQQFYAGASSPNGTPNVNIIGADATEAYMRMLPRGLKFTETGTITPAFNVPNAWTALALANLNFPVYKRLSFSLTSQDNFINDPPLGFKKNTFQFTAGVTYALK